MNPGPDNLPPRLAQKLLCWLLRDDLAEEVLGDLEEKFYVVAEEKSMFRARLNYWYQVINYLRPFAIRKSKVKYSNRSAMFKHYFKISYRNLLKQKTYSSIKIGGFAIGIAACMLLGLFVKHELSYDQFYEDQDQIFRMTNQYSENGYANRWTNLQGPLKPVLLESYAEIDQVARTVLWNWFDAGDNYIRPLDSKYNIYEEGFFYSDPELLEILEIEMVYGSRRLALSDPNSIVLSKSKADKYFPNENPVGKQLILNDDPENIYTIGGVMTDFPRNSHLKGDFILTMAGRKAGPGASGWCCSNYTYYVKVKPGTDKVILEGKLTSLIDTHVIDQLKTVGKTGLEEMRKYQSYYLQPIENVYLNPEEVGDQIEHGNSYIVWLFGIIAGVILVLASINFINLTTAKSTNRAKEVGLRKVVGSARGSLIYQYLTESVFYSALSVLVGLLLALVFLPTFNKLMDLSLTIPWRSWWFVPSLISGVIAIGVLSGIYPAYYLSRFQPIEVIRGTLGGMKKSVLQNGMVVFQFCITVILLISAVVTYQQYNHLMGVSLGYEKDQVVILQGLNISEEKKQTLKNELLSLSEVRNATLSDFLPVSGGAQNNITFWPIDRRNLDPGVEAARWVVDEDYLSTMGMKITQGRNFQESTSDKEGIILNESMVKSLNLENPIGTRLVDMFDGKNQVIGVVEDFYFESLGAQVRPLVMVKGSAFNTLSVKIAAKDVESAMASISGVWDEFIPNQNIRYVFMDQRFASMYEMIKKMGLMFLVFAGLAISIACLGLFALSAFMIEQRSKEISIRKVLGANLQTIFKLLTANFVKLVLIATVIAIPIGWYLMDELWSGFANRIDVQWWVFAGVACISILIALITVSFESIKAALINPANRLRSE